MSDNGEMEWWSICNYHNLITPILQTKEFIKILRTIHIKKLTCFELR